MVRLVDDHEVGLQPAGLAAVDGLHRGDLETRPARLDAARGDDAVLIAQARLGEGLRKLAHQFPAMDQHQRPLAAVGQQGGDVAGHDRLARAGGQLVDHGTDPPQHQPQLLGRPPADSHAG